MEPPVAIADGMLYVGVNDRETDLFESIWPLPRGVSYNAYVVADERPALVDTVKRDFFEPYLARVRAALDGRQPHYLVIHHMEPDHSGSVRLLREVFPDLTVVGTQRTCEFLGALYGLTEGLQAVEDGEELSLGDRRLRFFVTPMVHWPETMMSYEPGAGVLFSGDAFGGFGTLDGGIFDDQVDVEYFDDEILRYFSNIVGKYCAPVQKALGRLGDLEVRVVAPTHGPVWRSEPGRIIGDYDRWSRHQGEEGAVVAYASMYGNTTRMMEAVACGLADAGCRRVRVHDVSRVHASYVVRDAWRYRGLVLGGPTYDAGLFPPLRDLVELLAEKRLGGRAVGLFGTYGWSGGAVKALRGFAGGAKHELVEPVVEARFSPTADDLAGCRRLGQAMARRVAEG